MSAQALSVTATGVVSIALLGSFLLFCVFIIRDIHQNNEAKKREKRSGYSWYPARFYDLESGNELTAREVILRLSVINPLSKADEKHGPEYPEQMSLIQPFNVKWKDSEDSGSTKRAKATIPVFQGELGAHYSFLPNARSERDDPRR